MASRFTFVAIALAALALPAAARADAERPPKADSASSDDAGRAKQDRRAEERGPSDVTTCKRDADGMRGPERSRFMTQCLRERK